MFLSDVFANYEQYEEILKLVESTGNDISVISSNVYEYYDVSKLPEFPSISYMSEVRFVEIIKKVKKTNTIWIDRNVCEYFDENGVIPFNSITIVEENPSALALNTELLSKALLLQYSHLFSLRTKKITIALGRLDEVSALSYLACDKEVSY